MRIAVNPTAVRIERADVRLLPSFLQQGLALTSIRLTGQRDLPVVRLRGGNSAGYGEAPPLPTFTGLDAAATAAGLREACEEIVGLAPEEALAALHREPTLPGPVRCALDIALHDLIAKEQGLSVDELLGPRRQQAVRISRAIGFHPPDVLAKLVSDYRAVGISAFKVKVGRDLGTDLAAIEVVRRKAGDECEIAIDANESLSRQDAVALGRAARDFDVAYFEQPVARGDLEGLRAVRNTGLPVMADESVFDVSDVRRLHEAEAADLIAIKLIKCGGLAPAADIVRTGAELGLLVTVIDPLGSAISLHAGLAVAVTIQPHRYAHGLSAGLDVDAKFAPHAEVRGGLLAPLKAPGLGIDVDWPEDLEAW